MRRFLISLIIIALALFCSSVGARPKKKITPLRVACIGNSVTYGTGLADPAADSYPSQLQDLLGPGFKVGNFGRPSATLLRQGSLPYMQQVEFRNALEFVPDIAVIHLGLNDTDPRAWPAFRDCFMRDYLDLIDSVRSVNPKCRIILARMTPLADRHRRFESGTRDWHAEIQQYIGNVAKLSGSQLIDFYEPLHCHMNWFPDAIHPNKEGYGLLAQIVCSAITGHYGGLRLSPAFTDHMVLPRNRTFAIAGQANAGDLISLTINNQHHTALTDSCGRWSVTVDPLPQGGPYVLRVSSPTDCIELQDILAGEVWLCSGQSNMEFRLNQTRTAAEDIQKADNERIRLLDYKGRWATYNYQFSPGALDSINHLLYFTEPSWQRCNKSSAAVFSAIGYYFAQALADSLQCPVGIICNAVGGSGTEAWIDRTSMEYEFPAILRDWTKNDFIQDWVRGRAVTNMGENRDKLQRHPYEPCYLYEANIQQLCHFPINGILWYQGESNAHNKEAHAKLFDLLVRSWRKAWKNSDLPFYYTQLSSLNRPQWTWFRDSQRLLLDCEPHLGMAVSSDIGDSTDVHPTFKRPLGERLARWALHNDYGRKNLTPSGPLPLGARLQDNKVVVSFNYGQGMHSSDGKSLRTFEVAETEGLYHPASAEVRDGKIVLTCPAISHPRFVRYAWQPFTRANLVNGDNLPASTFRIEVSQ